MINILTIHFLTWFTSKKDYLENYANNDSAKKAATKLWNAIDGGDLLPLLLVAVLTVLICGYYYFPFNNKSGRHYHPKWWGILGLVALIVAFLTTIGCCCFLADNPGFDFGLIFKAALVNTLYAAVVYFFFSVIINRTGKSNAYPFPF